MSSSRSERKSPRRAFSNCSLMKNIFRASSIKIIFSSRRKELKIALPRKVSRLNIARAKRNKKIKRAETSQLCTVWKTVKSRIKTGGSEWASCNCLMVFQFFLIKLQLGQRKSSPEARVLQQSIKKLSIASRERGTLLIKSFLRFLLREALIINKWKNINNQRWAVATNESAVSSYELTEKKQKFLQQYGCGNSFFKATQCNCDSVNLLPCEQFL